MTSPSSWSALWSKAVSIRKALGKLSVSRFRTLWLHFYRAWYHTRTTGRRLPSQDSTCSSSMLNHSEYSIGYCSQSTLSLAISCPLTFQHTEMVILSFVLPEWQRVPRQTRGITLETLGAISNTPFEHCLLWFGKVPISDLRGSFQITMEPCLTPRGRSLLSH